jgi:osmotically-inducible protein OsmY
METDMKTSHLIIALFLTGLLAPPMAACSSTSTSESTGEYIDDSTISNKVRAQLIGDADLNMFQIDVTTYKGVVQLSGFVSSATAKERAESVAAGVQGVKEVRNSLIVK